METEAPTLEEIDSGSVADTLRAVMNDEPSEAPQEAPVEAVEDAPTEEVEQAEPTSEGRARDEKGRFVAQDKPEEAEGEASVETTPETEAPAVEDVLEPLPEWPVEKHEAFRKLSPEAQRFVLDQAGELSAPNEELNATAAKYKALDEIMAPRRDEWARNGMDETQVLRQLLSMERFAAEQPVEFTKWFLEARGIPLNRLVPQQEAKAETPEIDEAYADDPLVKQFTAQTQAFQKELEDLKKQNEELRGTWQTRQQQEEQARTSRIDNEIASFATATDEQGKLTHPYFETVRPIMAALMGKDAGLTLESAYDQACHAHPETRQKIAAAERAADERKRTKEAREKAEAAKTAGSSVSGAPGARSEPQPSGDDLRDQLAANFASVEGSSVI
jgi:hypothetical protein